MKKRYTSLPVRFLAFFLFFVTLCFIFMGEERQKSAPTHTGDSTLLINNATVVLDAGHGGEDGGAVSESGLIEKDLNLKITLLVAEMLRANGINVILTREKDELLYDKTVDYHGRKKVLDLASRRKIAAETENAVFVSIHMNTHPQKSCQGLQVWYSQNHPLSKELAENIQTTAQRLVQPQNHRSVKAATSAIYLLHKLEIPAVLVECGFLSNVEEAARLGDEEYRRALALSIFLSIIHTDFSNHT